MCVYDNIVYLCPPIECQILASRNIFCKQVQINLLYVAWENIYKMPCAEVLISDVSRLFWRKSEYIYFRLVLFLSPLISGLTVDPKHTVHLQWNSVFHVSEHYYIIISSLQIRFDSPHFTTPILLKKLLIYSGDFMVNLWLYSICCLSALACLTHLILVWQNTCFGQCNLFRILQQPEELWLTATLYQVWGHSDSLWQCHLN